MQTKKVICQETERIDDLQRNGLTIIQDTELFCFGLDAVLLSAYNEVKKGEHCLDLGTGTGILPLLLSAKTEAEHLTGLEIQPDSADMAKRSVIMNGLEERISIVLGDIKEASSLFGRDSMQVVTCNPPYMTGGHGLVNPTDSKAIARHEVLCTFEDVAREASRVLQDGGRFYLVHRPFRLVELLATLGKFKLEAKRIRFVHPYVDKEPSMVLIACTQGGRSLVQIEAPILLYESPAGLSKAVAEMVGF